MLLHEFLTAHGPELIARCRNKVTTRFAPSAVPAALHHGVPLFLRQLVETLRVEQTVPYVESRGTEQSPGSTEMGRGAAVHGADLLRLGYTIEQVVHDYGDVCQSVTQLATEQKEKISTDEFRTLNRCLDNAIADAVSSFGVARQGLIDDHEDTLQQRLSFFSREHQRLLNIALQSLTAIKTGHVGVTGATGTLLSHTLEELRSLVERAMSEIRLASESSALPHP